MHKQNFNQEICPYYSPEFGSIPQYISMKEGEVLKLSNKTSNHFIFLLSGSITISFNQYKNRPISEGEMFFCAKNNLFRWKATTATTLMLSAYNKTIFPCTTARAGVLYNVKARLQFDCIGVVMKDEVKIVINQMKHYLELGINCHHMYQLKHKELYLIFKHCYSLDEIVQIFYLSLNNDPFFCDLVLDNYLKVKTVKELANLLGYGLKTFEKLFKENFDAPPYQWIQKRKALQIHQRLMNPSISFKQIMYDFKFATSSHFNFYCKQHLGATPTQIRSEHKNNMGSNFEK